MNASLFIQAIAGLSGITSGLAYIDPNTGGMLFQILAVVFGSLSAILLVFSRQLRSLVARGRRWMSDRKNRQSPPDGQS